MYWTWELLPWDSWYVQQKQNTIKHIPHGQLSRSTVFFHSFLFKLYFCRLSYHKYLPCEILNFCTTEHKSWITYRKIKSVIFVAGISTAAILTCTVSKNSHASNLGISGKNDFVFDHISKPPMSKFNFESNLIWH